MFATGQGSDKGSEGAKHGKQNHHDPLIRPYWGGVALGGVPLNLYGKGQVCMFDLLEAQQTLEIAAARPVGKKVPKTYFVKWDESPW